MYDGAVWMVVRRLVGVERLISCGSSTFATSDCEKSDSSEQQRRKEASPQVTLLFFPPSNFSHMILEYSLWLWQTKHG